MNNEASIDVLNTLIIINNDRIEGYETASKETKEADLKELFAQFMTTSQKCKAELVREVEYLGGTPDEGTRTTGKFFRVWMDVKAMFTGNDRVAILNSCEYGEDVAGDTYRDALTNHVGDLSNEQQDMLKAQLLLLTADLNNVKSLRDRMSVHS